MFFLLKIDVFPLICDNCIAEVSAESKKKHVLAPTQCTSAKEHLRMYTFLSKKGASHATGWRWTLSTFMPCCLCRQEGLEATINVCSPILCASIEISKINYLQTNPPIVMHKFTDLDFSPSRQIYCDEMTFNLVLSRRCETDCE